MKFALHCIRSVARNACAAVVKVHLNVLSILIRYKHFYVTILNNSVARNACAAVVKVHLNVLSVLIRYKHFYVTYFTQNAIPPAHC